MSRLWDTPEYWARTEADELLRHFPNTATIALALSLDRSPGDYKRDPDFTRDIIADLKKRAIAGVRFWPEALELQLVEREFRAALVGMPERSIGEAAPAERSAFWWQNI